MYYYCNISICQFIYNLILNINTMNKSNNEMFVFKCSCDADLTQLFEELHMEKTKNYDKICYSNVICVNDGYIYVACKINNDYSVKIKNLIDKINFFENNCDQIPIDNFKTIIDNCSEITTKYYCENIKYEPCEELYIDSSDSCNNVITYISSYCQEIHNYFVVGHVNNMLIHVCEMFNPNNIISSVFSNKNIKLNDNTLPNNNFFKKLIIQKIVEQIIEKISNTHDKNEICFQSKFFNYVTDKMKSCNKLEYEIFTQILSNEQCCKKLVKHVMTKTEILNKLINNI
jgi:hypothetical protein